MVGGSKNLKISTNIFFAVTFQKKCIVEFSAIFVYLGLSDSERNKIAGSTFAEIFDWWKIENISCFYFWNKRRQKGLNFHFLKGCFCAMDSPMDMILGVFPETNLRLLKSITLQFFSKYSKSYNNLNVKSCLKLNGP